MGDTAYQQIKREAPISPDPAVVRYVNCITEALAAIGPPAQEVEHRRLYRHGTSAAGVFSTHPTDETRIRALEKYLPEALGLYQQDHNEGRQPECAL